MNSFEKLVKIFEDFPGIGPRQARRFVYFLLSRNHDYLSNLSVSVSELKKDIARCGECLRYFPLQGGKSLLCTICADSARDNSELMLVAKDTDLLAIERSGSFKGYYFVLGGTIPILEKQPERRISGTELKKIISTRSKRGLNEIIIALSATNEGENTSLFLEKFLSEDLQNLNLKLSHLGRGLSTGSELEYADKDTIAAALQNKK